MKHLLTIVFFMVFGKAFSQHSNKIFTSDIDNFWIAYDQIQKTDDHAEKLAFINKFYIDKATPGLKAFMVARNYNDSLYVKLIADHPNFWKSIKPNTLAVNSKMDELNRAVEKLKKLYPELKDAAMYFTIGGLRSGGTVVDNMVLIGAEIATGNPDTDMSDFKNDWLRNVFAKQSLDNIVYLNIHEYIHTQQKGGRNRVMNACIKEGSCDFMAELAMDKPIQTQYLIYGSAHADELKELFKQEMFSNNYFKWLFNGGKNVPCADLGYYIGYEICKSYYAHASDKTRAIKEIIELDYDDDQAVESFLSKSKFFNE